MGQLWFGLLLLSSQRICIALKKDDFRKKTETIFQVRGFDP